MVGATALAKPQIELRGDGQGAAMKGNVIGFDAGGNTGAISGHDGKRYDFATLDWHGKEQPRHGAVVDFVPEGERATRIYPMAPEYLRPSFAQFYFSLGGRISRSQYWLRFFLPVFVISVVLNLLQLTEIGGTQTLSHVFNVLVLWPGIAVLVKRIHDRNKTGALVWALYGPLFAAIIFTIVAIIVAAVNGSSSAASWGVISGALWFVVVGVGIWFFIEFGCIRGTVGPNRFGPDPVVEP
jgi:uncharacterized membrane protein YhaH (DUF805 family)